VLYISAKTLGTSFSVDREGSEAKRSKHKMAAEEGEIRIEEMCFDVVAVLPAGGCGVRMNMGLPKQVYIHAEILKK